MTDFYQTEGSTRDCLNTRLTSSVWLDCTDSIVQVSRHVHAGTTFDRNLNSYDKLFGKSAWFTIRHEGAIFTPVPHWNALCAQVIRDYGGRRALRRSSLLAALDHQGRHRLNGRELRSAIAARFWREIGEGEPET